MASTIYMVRCSVSNENLVAVAAENEGAAVDQARKLLGREADGPAYFYACTWTAEQASEYHDRQHRALCRAQFLVDSLAAALKTAG